MSVQSIALQFYSKKNLKKNQHELSLNYVLIRWTCHMCDWQISSSFDVVSSFFGIDSKGLKAFKTNHYLTNKMMEILSMECGHG